MKGEGSFIVRNRPSDGSPRAVGNSLAIVEKTELIRMKISIHVKILNICV